MAPKSATGKRASADKEKKQEAKGEAAEQDGGKVTDTKPIRCTRTEMPKAVRANVHTAVSKLYLRDHEGFASNDKKKRTAAHVEFATQLKGSLDISLGPQWNVLVGWSVGFACKKRNETLAMWRLGDQLMAIVWKSPGQEGPDTVAPPKEPAELEGDAAKAAATKAAAAKLLSPSELVEDSEEAKALAVIRDQIRATPDTDSGDFPPALRRRLTNELGPIWHVLCGPEFSVALAYDRRTEVVVQSGKTRILAFRHEQIEKPKVDWAEVLKAIPYLVAVLLAFGYMTISSVCAPDAASATGIKLQLRTKLCGIDQEQYMYTLAAITCGVIFLRRSKMLKKFLGIPV